jgi:sulfur carrier protein ThiS
MDVTVHLHTVLQRQTPDGLVRQLDLEIPSSSTIEELLNQLAIDFPLESLLLVVNGRLVEPDHILANGDQVNLMPAISGGGLAGRSGSFIQKDNMAG